MDKRTFQRLVAERRGLIQRIDRLTVFTVKDSFKQLSGHEQLMLMEQLSAMKWYYTTLNNRIRYYENYEEEVKGYGRPFTEDPVK